MPRRNNEFSAFSLSSSLPDFLLKPYFWVIFTAKIVHLQQCLHARFHLNHGQQSWTAAPLIFRPRKTRISVDLHFETRAPAVYRPDPVISQMFIQYWKPDGRPVFANQWPKVLYDIKTGIYTRFVQNLAWFYLRYHKAISHSLMIYKSKYCN